MKPAPTIMPNGPQECFDYLKEPEHYENESDTDYQSRQNLYQDFLNKCLLEGMTPEETIARSQQKIIAPRRKKYGQL